MPAWDSDFSPLLGMNDSLGFSFPLTPFQGILDKLFVPVGSSRSDSGAIHEDHEEKLDFAGKVGKGGATAQTQPLSLPSDWGGFQYTHKVPRRGADKHLRNTDRIRLDEQETARAAGSDIHVLIFHRCSYRFTGNRLHRAPQKLGAREQRQEWCWECRCPWNAGCKQGSPGGASSEHHSSATSCSSRSSAIKLHPAEPHTWVTFTNPSEHPRGHQIPTSVASSHGRG